MSAYTPEHSAWRLRRVADALSAANVPVPALGACVSALGRLPPCHPAPVGIEAEGWTRLLDVRDCMAGYGLWLARVAGSRLALRRTKTDDLPAVPNPHEALPRGVEPANLGRQLRLPPLPTVVARLDALVREDADPEPVDGDGWALGAGGVLLPRITFAAIGAPHVLEPALFADFAGVALDAWWHLSVLGHDTSTLYQAVHSYLDAFWQWHEDGADTVAAASALPTILAAWRVHASVGYLAHSALPQDTDSETDEDLLRHALTTPSGMRPAPQALANAWAGLVKRFGVEHALQIIDVRDAPQEVRDLRVAFVGEGETAFTLPAVLLRGAGARRQVLHRAVEFRAARDKPAALTDAERIHDEGGLARRMGGDGWLQAVRTVVETDILMAELPDAGARRQEALEDLGGATLGLVDELIASSKMALAGDVLAFGAKHHGLTPVPALVDGSWADLDGADPHAAVCVDWANSEVAPLGKGTRGRILKVVQPGMHLEGHVVRPARVVVASGERSPLLKLAQVVVRGVRDASWCRIDPFETQRAADEFVAWLETGGPDFFKERRREAEILKGWARSLEADVDGRPDRAVAILGAHRPLLARILALQGATEQPGWLRDTPSVTDSTVEVDVHYVYAEKSTAGSLAGIVTSPVSPGGGPPRIVVSRGPKPPPWIEALRVLLRNSGDVLAASRDPLLRALETASATASDFESREWRLGFLGRLLAVADFNQPGGADCLKRLDRWMRKDGGLAGVQLVPGPGAEARMAPGDLERLRQQGDAATIVEWFSDEHPQGAVLELERRGLYEESGVTPQWHVPARLALSAGPHTALSSRLQPLVRAVHRWIGSAPWPAGKAQVWRDALHRLVLKPFLERAAACRDEQEAVRTGRHLLAGRGGIASFLTLVTCRDRKIQDRVQEAAAQLGVAIDTAAPDSPQRCAVGDDGDTVAFVTRLPESDPPVLRRVVGGASQARPADVALRLLDAIARFDEVDPDGSEARAIVDTLTSLSDPQANVGSGTTWLVTKAYGLRHALPREHGEAVADAGRRLQHAMEDGESALRDLGILVHSIAVGDDVRQHEGRYKVSSATSKWTVARVRRPCLMKSGRVVQVGIVDTD